ncbi:MAG TPA: glycosyl hydrolase family 65 protein [Kofleriaceae bacterium]
MTDWELVYDGFDPSQEGVRETLCTLGNGYVGTRGAAAEASSDGVHYPGTYIAGCYDRLASKIGDRELEHEDLINAPNWLPLTFRHAGEDWLDLANVEILSYRQVLDLRRAVLMRNVRVRDGSGRITLIASRRLVSMADRHVAAQELVLTAENWSGRIDVRSALDGTVENRGVERYRLLASKHLVPVEARPLSAESTLLEMSTVQSQIRIAVAARTRAFVAGKQLTCDARTSGGEDVIVQELTLDLHANQPMTIEKVVSIFTSRDRAISAPGLAAAEKLTDAGRFEQLLEPHALAWEQLWRSFELRIEMDPADEPSTVTTGVILRLHVFHLLQTASRNSTDLDVGVGARGLHGEAYKGHVFWDELFVFPLLNFRAPEITRSLLLYRYRRLDGARRAARTAGHRGAMFPWRSGSDGREETPLLYYNPRSHRWITDTTRLQRHVGAAIAYNIWQYYQVTGDVKFLGEAGAETFLEIARFFASLATWNATRERFDIRHIMGPDEFHVGYPDSREAGLDNNAYTNVMAAWLLWRAREVLDALPHDRRREVRESLALDDAELARWDAISRRITLPFLDGGILAQFESYDRLPELDWDGYRARYGNIQRLDLILESEGDSPNRYKASKQADVLMLFFLFSSEELCALFERLDYPFDSAVIPKTIDYYLRRTSDGSTLSRVAHAWVLARANRVGSWEVCREALTSDIADIQNGTTREGIHLGAMAGSVDLILRCYTGLELREDVLWLNPRLPAQIRRLELLVRYRGHTLELAISQDKVEVSAARCDIPTMQVAVRGTIHDLKAGERRSFSL